MSENVFPSRSVHIFVILTLFRTKFNCYHLFHLHLLKYNFNNYAYYVFALYYVNAFNWMKINFGGIVQGKWQQCRQTTHGDGQAEWVVGNGLEV